MPKAYVEQCVPMKYMWSTGDVANKLKAVLGHSKFGIKISADHIFISTPKGLSKSQLDDLAESLRNHYE
ncbi:hypothetical protein PG995_008328 [Apiospora arundinis]|uniref:Uncharacterized protein n=1 Tax=Apiospora arundinis TaxID=335852 RepID=A0ABR2I0L2_9PEZI